MVHLAQVQPNASIIGLDSSCARPGTALRGSSGEAAEIGLAITGPLTASIAAKEPAQPKAVNTVC